jgi:hypothetical protein
MKARIQKHDSWFANLRTPLCIACLLLIVSVGCSPVSTTPSPPTAPSATELPALTATASSTATSEALIPAGWSTYTNQQCEYAISFPSEMQVEQGSYSLTLMFNSSNPDSPSRYFVYVSVIDPEIQRKVEQGAYDFEVYNYDPVQSERLINLQVGESISTHPNADMAQWFTYQRKPDTSIGGYAAQTYENLQPWEAPLGTKEIRYYLIRNGCTYLIGGYLDTTQSSQPGAITEDLFHQIVSTMRVTP